MSKIMSVEEVARCIQDGDAIWMSGGGGGINDPDLLLGGIEKRFLDTGIPKA